MIKAFLKKNRLTFIGLVIGAVGGFLYRKFVGYSPFERSYIQKANYYSPFKL